MQRLERLSGGSHDDASRKSSEVKSSLTQESSFSDPNSVVDTLSDVGLKRNTKSASSKESAWDGGLTPTYAVDQYIVHPSCRKSRFPTGVRRAKKYAKSYNAHPNVAPRRPACKDIGAVRSALGNELSTLLCKDPTKRKMDVDAKYPASLDISEMPSQAERAEEVSVPCMDESNGDVCILADGDYGLEYGLELAGVDNVEENEEWEEARIAASEAAARACDLLEDSEKVSQYGLNAVPAHRTVLVTEAAALALVDAEQKRAKYEALTHLNTIEERFSKDKLHSQLKHSEMKSENGHSWTRVSRENIASNDRLVSLFKKLDVLLKHV